MASIRSIDDLRREKENLLKGFVASTLFEILEDGGVLVSAVQQGLANDWPGTHNDLIESEVKRLISDLVSSSESNDRAEDEIARSVPVYPVAPPNWPKKSTHCLAVGSLNAFGRASHNDAGFVVLAGSEFSDTDNPAISNDNYKDIWLEIRTASGLLEEVGGKLLSTEEIEFSSAALAATVVRAGTGKTEDWEDARRQPLKSRGRGGSPRYLIREEASPAISSSDEARRPSVFTASATSSIAMQASARQLEFSIPDSDIIKSKESARPDKKRRRRRR